MALTFEAVGPACCGARVSGEHVAQLAFDEDEIGQIKAALADFHVLVFPGPIRPPALMESFASCFGAIAGTPGYANHPKLQVPGSAQVRIVGQVDPEHPSPSMRNVDFEWHTDGAAHRGTHSKESFLQGRVVTQRGGETCFVSTYEIYDALAPALKTRLDGVRVLMDQSENQEGTMAVDRRAVHSFVVTHPDSGRRALFFQPYATAALLGLPADEADELLITLIDRVLAPGRVYEHKWSEGDLVMFDTLGTWHRRNSWHPDEPRAMEFIYTRFDVPDFPIPEDAPRIHRMSDMFRATPFDAPHDHRERALQWAHEQIMARKSGPQAPPALIVQA